MGSDPPLTGITVVALEQAVSGPLATRHLADLGARVIKIERPDGGDFSRAYDTAVKGLSAHFVWLNRSKESLALDLKNPGAREVVDRLLAKADVFVQNLAPGAAERLGLGAAALRARDPRLITCTISGFGEGGPYAGKKAYDLLLQAETGLLSITGTGQTPSRVGISVADIAAGTYAYSGILAALLARERSGEGATLDVSLFDALAEWMSFPAYYTAGGSTLPRSGPNHVSIAPYGPFRGADGGELFLAVQNAREWTAFCARVLERPDMAEDPRFRTNAQRLQNRDALRAEIEAIFAALPPDTIAARLDDARIAHARMHSVEEFLTHPQLTARNRWRDTASEAGTLRTLLPPVHTDGVEPVVGAVPALGEHTRAILAELGFTGRIIENLTRRPAGG
ncbi:MAG: CoA transferase [Acidimicrobiia bacterium]|nr:CoA transferase [Acidimicrobiia bacterium]